MMTSAGLRMILGSLALSLLAAGVLTADRAAAHPHVWVIYETTVHYAEGKVAALEHKWTFDEFYTTMAVEGLDANKDGVYDRTELAQVNMDGLKEFGYFTSAKLGTQELKLGPPRDYWLEHKGGILSLHFTLPLAEPVLANAEGFNFIVYDPSYFIAFDFAKETPVRLAGAPTGCKVDVQAPKEDAEDAKKLGEAFFNQLGGDSGYGLKVAKTATVTCPKE